MNSEMKKALNLYIQQPPQKIRLETYNQGLEQHHINPNDDIQKFILLYSQDIRNKMLFAVYQYEVLKKWNNVITNNEFSEASLIKIHSCFIMQSSFTLMNIIPSIKEEIRNAVYKISFALSKNEIITILQLNEQHKENKINKWASRYKKISDFDKSLSNKVLSWTEKIRDSEIERIRGEMFHNLAHMKGIWRHVPYIDENKKVDFKNVIDRDYKREINLIEKYHPLIVKLYEYWVDFCKYAVKSTSKTTYEKNISTL